MLHVHVHMHLQCMTAMINKCVVHVQNVQLSYYLTMHCLVPGERTSSPTSGAISYSSIGEC